MRRAPALLLAFGFGLLAFGVACTGPDRERIQATSKGKYDPATGKLSEITYDKNKNGRIDTWVSMDGPRPVSARIDSDEDGKIDRWEYYDSQGRLTRAGESRAKSGKPDLWIYMDASAHPERLEYLETSNVTGRESIVRREFYKDGVKVRAEEDTDGDGVMDRWETFDKGRLRTVEFDDARKRDGTPTQRFTYDDRGNLTLIESSPDGKGGYLTRVVPGRKK